MIKQVGDRIRFTTSSEELLKSIVLLQNLKEYFEKYRNKEGAAPIIEALTVAIEVMTAFYCEKFSEDEDV